MEGEGVMGNDGWVEGDGGAGMGWSCRWGGMKDEVGKGRDGQWGGGGAPVHPYFHNISMAILTPSVFTEYSPRSTGLTVFAQVNRAYPLQW